MTRGPASRLHGASISAPDEGFSSSESPEPPRADRGSPRGSERSRRLARLSSALRTVLGLLLVIGVAVGVAWSAHRYALTSARFAIRKIHVDGGKRFGPAEVQKAAGIPPNANLFSVDTVDAERRLLEDPWILQASITRRLPSMLHVELREREARALTVLSGQTYLVSAEGEPFKRLAPDDSVDLPIITGLDAEQLARDRKRELERLTLGLEVLRHYERLGMSRVYVPQEIHVAEGGAVTLTIGKQGISILLGKGPFRQRLLMAERVVEETRRAGKLPAIVFADNVAHPERVVVRMR